ncbi:MAG: sigma-70 family RNA polymerase sigma factor [Planctomycetota bacterium]
MSESFDRREAASRVLIRRHQGGDGEAFAELVRLWDRALFALTYRLIGHREEAEDARQTVWVRVCRHLADIVPERGFSPWLYHVAVNVCRDALRRRRSARATSPVDACELADGAASPPEVAQHRELRQLLARALLSLPDDERECLVLRHYEELPVAAIASIVGRPRTSVHTCLDRAFSRLARSLGHCHSGTALDASRANHYAVRSHEM